MIHCARTIFFCDSSVFRDELVELCKKLRASDIG